MGVGTLRRHAGHADVPNDDEDEAVAGTIEPDDDDEPEGADEDDGEDAAVLNIDFASEAAAELADDEDLTAVDFEGVEGTGEDGAYRKPDVEAIIENMQGE